MSSVASAPSSTIKSSASASPTVTPIGVFQGQNPIVYSPTDPLILFIVQAFIIIVTCRLLHYPLSKIRQPRVIAEVIGTPLLLTSLIVTGGILLGPSVMGRIPNFSATIFPAAAMPNLTLAANIGLVFFLFLVGLEVDLRIILRNSRAAFTVSLLGMILPFGLGCAIAVGIYNTFTAGASQPSFGIFLLFMGVSFSITAFPVLARILTELKLLQTAVGVITLSAGVGNDVTGWVLLALTVALVNASNGITVLYVILCAIGIILVLTFIVRPLLYYFAKKNNSIQSGPSEMMMSVIIMLVLVAAFYTDIIGVHPIFGGFLVGLIIPHEHGFAVKVTEKIEDFVSALFLPLYFALSGLKTNIGLLDTGTIWGYTIGIILIALFSKITGSSLAARLNGMVWRESFTIGVLMSCKGLVELIVLNVGLQAGILSQTVFTMFVVMALVTTFLTTPVVTFLYPQWYQRKIDLWRRGEIDWDGNPIAPPEEPPPDEKVSLNQPLVKKCMVVLNRMEDLPTMMTITKLLATAPPQQLPTPPASSRDPTSNLLRIHCLRLMELTQRTSAVMKVSERHFDRLDPVINVFRTFGKLNEVVVTAQMAIVPSDSFPDSVKYQGINAKAEMVIVPWTSQIVPFVGTAATIPQDDFIKQVLDKVESHVSIMIDTSLHLDDESNPSEPSLSRSISMTSLRNRHPKNASVSEFEASPVAQVQERYHIFLPYYGGKDDRVALMMVIQLLRCPEVKATLVRIRYSEVSGTSSVVPPAAVHTPTEQPDQHSNDPIDTTKSSAPITSALSTAVAKAKVRFTHGAEAPTSTPVTIETEPDAVRDDVQVTNILESIPSDIKSQLQIEHVVTSTPLQYAVQRAKREFESKAANYHLVIVGRGTKFHRPTNMIGALHKDLKSSVKIGQGDMVGKSCLGDVGEGMLLGHVKGGLLVVQSGNDTDESWVKHALFFFSGTDLVDLESELMPSSQRGAQSPSDSDDKDIPERNPSPEIEDKLEAVADTSTSTSTSSDWMGPPHGHKIIDAIEYNSGIFARAKEEGKLDIVLKHYGMTEEDLYPWKKKYRKLQSKSQPKRPPPKRPPKEEERSTRKRPKSDSSSDEMTRENPKNLGFYFGANKNHKSNLKSKDSQRQTEPGKGSESKDGAKQNTDAMASQTFRAENMPPNSNHFITETPKDPIPVPEYTTLSKIAKLEASRAKVNGWLNGATSPISSIATSSLKTSPSVSEPLFGYNVGYYITGAAAAGLAALIGAGIYIWRGAKEYKEENDDEDTEVNTRRVKRSRRLHARDWRREGED